MTAGPFRVVLFGQAGVGKTCLFHRFKNLPLDGPLSATIAPETATATIETSAANVQIDLMDTAGQERYMSLNRFYFRGARGVIAVIDGSDPECVNGLEELFRRYGDDIPREAVTIIAVNKIDLVPGFDTAPITQFAEERRIQFVLVSAVENYQVDFLFKTLAEKLMEVGGIRLARGDEIELDAAGTRGNLCC
jgi:Ras-related protein Rab-1A